MARRNSREKGKETEVSPREERRAKNANLRSNDISETDTLRHNVYKWKVILLQPKQNSKDQSRRKT